MSMSIGGANGLTFPDSSTQNTAATGFGFKNRIINGAMMIDQRNAGASVTLTSGLTSFPVDRFTGYHDTSASSVTVQRGSIASAGVPGFVNAFGWTTGTGATATSTQQATINQNIEGLNVADLNWGTANAASVTISFWVSASLTGIYSVSLRNSAVNRSYVTTYTVNSANTWERKTITIPGDTTGTWLTDTGIGIRLNFDLGSGSSKSTATLAAWQTGNYTTQSNQPTIIGNTGATFYITGVQLEKGSTATSFDYRPYGTELALCQRYCQKSTNRPLGIAQSGYGNVAAIQFPVTMRTAPTLTSVSYASPNGGTVGTVNAVTISADGFSQYNNSNNSSVNYEYTISYTAGAEL